MFVLGVGGLGPTVLDYAGEFSVVALIDLLVLATLFYHAFVVGQKEPYDYLIKSINKFLNQEELLDLIKMNNFKKCSYRNLSGGIVSIHSGWKI